ncbi:MAG: 23S rRNA (uracil(1939)-C(5))-methyltransferase RlmD [Anaerotardibacter sp.]
MSIKQNKSKQSPKKAKAAKSAKASVKTSAKASAKTKGGKNFKGAGAKRSQKKAFKGAKRSSEVKDFKGSTKPKGSYCPIEKDCGACQHLRTPYEKQLQNKQDYLIDLFEHLIGVSTVIEPILGMDNPFYYRNKVVSPYAPGRKLKKSQTQTKQRHKTLPYEVLCGMYKEGTHRIIPSDSCLLENKNAKQVILTIRDLMVRFNIDAYNEDTGEGFLRHAIVRVGHNSNEVLVTLVTNENVFPRSKAFVKELVAKCPFITTVVQNINTRQTNVILGEKERTLYGPGFILDTLCGLSFRISSHSFYQVNAIQTEVLYRSAITIAQLTGTEVVLDAYCGTGTIGLVAAAGLPEKPEACAKRVIGVDVVEDAIVDARNNALHNGIDNAQFFAEDASEFMVRLASDKEEIDVLLMDPPRAGSTETFLDAAATMNPKRIVYISCNPKTQVRDAEYLAHKGYVIKRMQAVDMFPHTNHIESIILMEKIGG